MVDCAKRWLVYILTNKHHTVLYAGVTSDLIAVYRSIEVSFILLHLPYNIDKLVYYCLYATIEEAIEEEKELKVGAEQQRWN